MMIIDIAKQNLRFADKPQGGVGVLLSCKLCRQERRMFSVGENNSGGSEAVKDDGVQSL